MKKITKPIGQLDLKDIEVNNRRSLKDDLKESHKSTCRPLTNQKTNNKNSTLHSRENEALKKSIYNKDEDKNHSILLNDEKLKIKTDIKKIKIVNNENKNDNANTPSNLRRIYVDLNEINSIKDDPSDILSHQKTIYNDNSIRTCQYTILTFFPLALINQFKSAFNWFFLIYNIIAVIPALSDLDPAAEVTPFIVVLILNLIKEAIEDYRKYNNDKKANNTRVLIFKDKRFVREKCQNIRVGNIIKIYKEDLIPADVLIVKSSLKNGLAYMQTSNLDGENTLKPREALSLTQNKINNKLKNLKNTFDYANDHFFVEVIHPNKNIYDIEGTAFYDHSKNHINIKNVLLRGARLKNVDYIYGIVIYNGHDTKLMQNIEHSSNKLSTIDVKLNYIILIIFIAYLLMICISTVIGVNLRKDNLPDYEKGERKAEYLLYYDIKDPKHGLEITRILSNNFLIYNTLIPVSIFVTFIICKILQTINLQQFSPEYRKDKNDNIKCFSTGLIDQLGLVKYIFSDKTGTLTKNEMVFKGCSINRELFDESVNNNDSMATDTYIAQNMFNIAPQSFFGTSPSKKNLSCNDSTKGWTNQSKLTSSKVADSFPQNNLFKFFPNNNVSTSFNIGGIPFSNKYEPFEQFFINIIVNHDVLIEQNEYDEIYFQGASPDEITLVTAAYEFGFCFKSREKGIITVEILDHSQINVKREKYFKILQKFDFTSERQCSSIVVEDLLTKKITLYIKGSDNKIFKSLDNYSKHNILPKTKEHLDNFAKQGLRTLCFGFKNISKEEYIYWDNKYREAKHKTLESKLFQKDLDSVIKYLESNVTLLGVSALEDKLQDEVEKDIKKFIDAGINFWMITGDKMDTAESIGYSCGIFSQDCEVYKIKDTNNVNSVINAMKEIKDKIAIIDDELAKIKESHDKKMNEKKINSNANNSKKKVNRYNSIDMPNTSNIKEQIEIIKFNYINKNSNANEYKENSKNNLNNKDNSETYPDNKLKINDNNDIKTARKKQDIQMDKNSLNNKNNNNSFDAKMLQLKDGLNEIKDNSQSSDNNKKIFKYVAINIDNVSNFGENSFIQNKVKKIAESANSSEIFAAEETEKNKLDNISKDKSDEDDENKSIKEAKKYKDIPLDENKFNNYFDFCRNELSEMAIKHSNRLKLFQIKYLYPIPQDSSFFNKKITSKFSLILEGQSINTCMTEGEAADLFWDLIQRSRSLICCRASPSQKSLIVDFVKKRTDSVTLGIGDGGNDVNMIRTASVGIGIFGKEGYQAAYNSDYAISQFKYLKRLLFNEGRNTLSKNCYFLYHYFFKNFIFTIVLFWFGIYSFFSGGNYYYDYYTLGFNSFITVFPICIMAVNDEEFDPNFESFTDKERQLLFTFLPNIYKEYRDSYPFNIIKFLAIFAISFLFSFVCFIIPVSIFKYNYYGYGSDGYQYSIWDSSIITYFAVFSIHYIILLFDTLCYNSGIIIIYVFQFFLTLSFMIFFEKGKNWELYGTLNFMMKNWINWLTYIITCWICLLFFYILRRGEYYFGGFILNKIKLKQFDIFIEKFYQKKIEQMTRVVRNVAKFKRFYYNKQENIQEDNLNDQKMKKIVDEFKDKQKKYININLKKNKSSLK